MVAGTKPLRGRPRRLGANGTRRVYGRSDRLERDVLVRLDQAKDEGLMRIEARTARLALASDEAGRSTLLSGDPESRLGVGGQTAKLFGQLQRACAFCEPIRDCPHHADLEDHAEPKSWFQLQQSLHNRPCFLLASG